MIRIPVKYYLLIVLAIGLFPFYLNADSIKKGGDGDLEKLVKITSTLNSAVWATYIGKTKKRLYIEYGTMVHVGSYFTKEPSYTIYWFPVSMVTKDQLRIFKNNKRNGK